MWEMLEGVLKVSFIISSISVHMDRTCILLVILIIRRGQCHSISVNEIWKKIKRILLWPNSGYRIPSGEIDSSCGYWIGYIFTDDRWDLIQGRGATPIKHIRFNFRRTPLVVSGPPLCCQVARTTIVTHLESSPSLLRSPAILSA